MILCFPCGGMIDAKPTPASYSTELAVANLVWVCSAYGSGIKIQKLESAGGVGKSPGGLGGGRASSSGGLRRGAVDACASRKQASINAHCGFVSYMLLARFRQLYGGNGHCEGGILYVV